MQLQAIRKELPHGAISKIAKKVGVSAGTVTQFFNGTINAVKSTEILEEAAKIIKEKKEREAKVMEQLKGLCNETSN